MNDPKFLVVGAARAGTTALYSYLKQHPRIFLPDLKEPCFFCFSGERLNYKKGKFSFAITDIRQYGKIFKKARPGQVTGEMSTPYLYLYETTIKNIKKHVFKSEELKIVIVLRNPVDRAYSQYLWKVRDGREELSFDEALREENRRMDEHYSFDYFYSNRGLYYNQVKGYLENFENVKIILYEDFRNTFANTMKGLCEFLSVDPHFQFEQKDDVNTSYVPRFSALSKLISMESRIKFKILNYIPGSFRLLIKEHFNRFNSLKQPPAPMSDNARKFLKDFFKNDIQKLQALTNIDLSHWTNP
jgi:hypothetical protein